MNLARIVKLVSCIGLVVSSIAGTRPSTAAPDAAEAGSADRPNILFLFADDQRKDTIGAYGNPHIQTPHIDSIVEKGFSFRRAYCMGSIHGAVCQPSRAMLLSGRTLYRVPMDLRGVPILPQVLHANGYVTFGTGKWHNGGDSFLRGFEKGKAVFLGGMSDHTKVPVRDVTPDGTFTPVRAGDRFSSELFADVAIEFLESLDGEAPFFAYVSFTAPHDPRQPPEKYREMYYKKRPPLPANFMPQHPFHNGWMTGRDETLAPWPRTEDVLRDQLAEYYGLITHLDDQIGRVLDALEKTGRARNTIVVYSADQGLAIGSHGLLGKQSLYEHAMGAPLVFAGPKIPAGKSSEALVYLLDVFPTLCSLTGVTPPEGVEGQNLRPIWEGSKTSVRDSLFTTYEDLMRAVRDDRWKLIRYPKIHYTQLFDLQNDPHELQNLASDPVHRPTVDRLMRQLETWQKATDDKAPLTAPTKEPMEIDLTGRKRKPDACQPEWIVKKYFQDP